MVRQSSKEVYRTVVVVWLTLSVASVVFAALTWHQLSRKLAGARQAFAIQQELDSVLKSMLDTEAGQRGFIITGDDRFLQHAQAGEAQLPAVFGRLAQLSRDDPAMVKHVMDLRAQIEVSLTYYHDVIKVARAEGFNKARDIVAKGQGERIMDKIRERVTEISQMRSDLISDDGAGARFQLLRASLTSLAAGILGIGAGLLALWLSWVAREHQARERELIQEKLQAERSSQEKSVFLANVSHEIRTPMNAILGFSELLQSDLREPKHRQYLQSIRSSAGSLLQLINDILDMSKIESGMMELRPEPTDPREICEFINTVFTEPAFKKGVKLDCEVAADVPHSLLLDRLRLRQILVNLVGNAVKFTDRGQILVHLGWEKQATSSHITLTIDVEDTGVGIPQDKLGSIFKPFVQVGANHDKEKQGTGLGLSIVKRLTEVMQGTVEVKSVLGKGSTFHLRFPDIAISARLPAPDETAAGGEEVDFNALRPVTLLVVDDNEINCQLVRELFSGTHHRLYFGSTGEEAVNKAVAIHPEVILLDIRMPGMDGREALARIRKIPGLELTPVIAVTASSLVGEAEATKEGFSGFVRKPFTKRELFTELTHFIPRQSNEPNAEPSSPVAPAAEAAKPGPVRRVPPALLSELRRLEAQTWPSVRDSLAINECKVFAKTLEQLGQRWRCQPLIAYGQAALAQAENYAVVELEEQLAKFPALINRLDGKAAPAFTTP